MSISEPLAERTYEPDKSYLLLMYIGVCFFGAFALLSWFLPVIVNDGKWPNLYAGYLVSLVLFLFFCGFGIACFLSIRKLRVSSVSIDDRGLWKTQDGKENSFIRWETIKSVRDRYSSGRLEMIGSLGEKLIDVEYQLKGFDELRYIVLSKIPKSERVYPQRYKKKRSVILFQIGFLIIFILAMWWCIQTASVWLAVALLVMGVFIVRDFLRVASAITIWREQIIINFQLRQIALRPSDIEAVVFEDYFDKGARVPQLALKLTSGKSIILSGFIINEVELYRELTAFKGGLL